MGIVKIPILFGEDPKHVICFIKLYVTNTASSYNMILGRPTLVKLQAITSTHHLKIKFPALGRVGKIKGDREASRFCYGPTLTLDQSYPTNMRKAHITHKRMEKRRKHLEHQQNQRNRRREVQIFEMANEQLMEEFEPRMDANLKKCLQREKEPVIFPVDETKKIELIPGQGDKKIGIRVGLDSVFKEDLTRLLREYADIFA